MKAVVIGAGHMGRYHAEKLARLSGVDLIAVVDADASRAAAIAQKLGSAPLSDYRQIFGKADAAVIAVPTDRHHEIARACLEHGVHILVEKPIARTLAEAQAMIARAQEAGVTLMVAENYRFMAVARQCKALVEAGAVGTLRMVQLQEEAPFRPAGWRNSRVLKGGGVFIDGGIHKVDLLLYLAGMPARLYAVPLPPGLPGLEAEDGVVVTTRSAS